MTMVLGTSGSSGVQSAFCWTQFLCTPPSEKIAVWESAGGMPHGRESRRGFTQNNAVRETGLHLRQSNHGGQKEASSDPQLDVIVGNDLPPSITLPFIWLSCSFAFWPPTLPFFYYIISILVSPLLSFIFKPSFLLFFPSALFLPSILPLIIYSLFDLLISFPPSSVMWPLWSLWLNILPTLLASWFLCLPTSPSPLYLGPTEGATSIL